MKKRVIGALYGIFLEEPLSQLRNWQMRIEKKYLNYCRWGCNICYRWKCRGRNEYEGTPYKKFRRGEGRR